MPLLVRFKAIWVGLAGTGAGSSISCRCESLMAANPSMLMLGGQKMCGCCEKPPQCVLYPADWFAMRAFALTTPFTLHSDLSQRLVGGLSCRKAEDDGLTVLEILRSRNTLCLDATCCGCATP